MSRSLQPHGLQHAGQRRRSSSTISWSLLKFMSLESVMLLNHLILCRPVFPLSSIFPSIRGFFNESALHIRWPKYWSFTFSISPFNEYSGLISFRIDWFDLHTVQGTLKSLLQHQSMKASILWHSAFFLEQLSQLYMTIRKIVFDYRKIVYWTIRKISLTLWTYVSKVMSLSFFCSP